MNKPTRRKTTDTKPRARSDSARFSASGEKQSLRKNHLSEQELSKVNNQPLLWAKEKPRKGMGNSSNSFLKHIFGSRRLRVVFLLVAFLTVVGLVDSGMNWEKVYPGVSVGEVDLSGKTVEEATKLLEDTYGSRLLNKKVYVFANEEASKNLEASLVQTHDESFAEQHSPEEVQANKLVWSTDTKSLGAILDTNALVEQALAYGREDGGVFSRLGALFNGFVFDPWLRYNDAAVEVLAKDIDLTIGNPRVNYDVKITKGHAELVVGHDGSMINRDVFKYKLDASFLAHQDQHSFFVAHAEYAALQIDEQKAQQTCDRINRAIKNGAQFTYGGITWDVDAVDLGSWVQTKVVEVDKTTYALEPYVSYDRAKRSILREVTASFDATDIKVTFINDNSAITVHTQSSGMMPQSREAIDHLHTKLFESDEIGGEMPLIEIGATTIPETMSLQDALDSGVVEKISEYKTEYTAGVENRNHNIHLVADLLDNSIVGANGGVWSFNKTAGNCNEEAGFKGAGSIIDGEYVDEIGGGICQVATTVFNAVYDSGLPVLQRHNHSLYIESYPVGRDAAVSWPDLDLRWENNTSSDILLQTDHTDTSITVALYGISPNYEVTTDEGKWQKGAKFKKRTVTDDTLGENESYVKTYGSNGSEITVIRTVTDREGKVVFQDSFTSVYDPKDEIIIKGPKKDKRDKTEEGTAG